MYRFYILYGFTAFINLLWKFHFHSDTTFMVLDTWSWSFRKMEISSCAWRFPSHCIGLACSVFQRKSFGSTITIKISRQKH